MRVPVVFTLQNLGNPNGYWQEYVPGPRQPIPWEQQDAVSASADALPDTGAYPVGSELKLLTPAQDG